jgi:hypothetical protein
MKLDAARLPALLDDLDASLRELVAPFERGGAGWDRGPAGRWTAGQHVEHVGRILAVGADALERAADALRRGDLERRPWRDPIQAWFVGVVTRKFPRGGRSPKSSIPGATPGREAAFALVAQGAVRHRAVADRLNQDERERLWIWNPYAPRLRWHYTLPEIVRVQASHARHHARGAAEAALGPPDAVASGPGSRMEATAPGPRP